jgi:predicted enzyme related to lactoylglutathione lyase
MPKRDEAPLGAPCWVDLFSSDPEGAETFYGGLFGWTAEHAGEELGGYINFSKDGHLVAGCMRNDGQAGAPDMWSVYLASDHAGSSVDAATANGGQVVAPAMDVAHLGSMAVLTDAGQAVIGVWQPGAHKGFGLIAEPGTPAWFELHTRHYEASVKFYEDVFKWDTSVMSDTPEFRYTTLGEGAEALAGIMDATGYLPEGEASAWHVYFAVEDTDAAAAKVTELGGTILQEAKDTPYGRLAQVTDPTGAMFKVVGPNKE